MKSCPRKFLLLALVFACTACLRLAAQNIDGIWRGYFIDRSGEQYKLEFQIKQSSQTGVTGVSYSYLDVRFYGKATMTGSFIKSGANLKIREIKTVEVKNMAGNGTCIMNYNLVYSRSGREEYLEGTFLGKQEVLDGPNPNDWGDCGGGKVFLRRVPTSDFYTEPFLRNQKKTTTPPPVVKTDKPVNTPPRQPQKPATNPPVTKTPQKQPVTKTPVIEKDTARNKPVIPPSKQPVAVIPRPEVLKTRQNELTKVLEVTSPAVTVKLYDNGEIDDDTISVYLDNKLVLSQRRLSTAPLSLHLTMEEDGEEHELVMVAENLGRIPPNTSLMIVEAGEDRYRVQITSTKQKNAVVRFRYKKRTL
ncbi:hypothetical protein JMG10_15450 [Nostoc ellipsosporum NOK]|nr:hypothetical protein [Nostoc ellipsosporum NOK]